MQVVFGDAHVRIEQLSGRLVGAAHRRCEFHAEEIPPAILQTGHDAQHRRCFLEFDGETVRHCESPGEAGIPFGSAHLTAVHLHEGARQEDADLPGASRLFAGHSGDGLLVQRNGISVRADAEIDPQAFS